MFRVQVVYVFRVFVCSGVWGVQVFRCFGGLCVQGSSGPCVQGLGGPCV